MDDETRAVIQANEAFYTAFRTRDSEAMAKLWADRPEVTCIHPGWDALYGYDAVIESWLGILSNPTAPRIRCRDSHAFVVGEIAFVICHEILSEGILAATNTFVREGAAWKMLHHQASPMAVAPKEQPKSSSALH